MCDVILDGVALGQAAARGTGGVHQAMAWDWEEGCKRRDVAREDREEADELAVRGHSAHNVLLRTWAALLP
jgi:hypothetical protein